MPGKKNPAARTLRVTYVKSSVGYRADQGHTIRSLGLRRVGETVDKPDTPDVRGMILKVAHLVSVAELEE